MADIFISYSSKDKESTDQLSELLTSAGLQIFFTEETKDLVDFQLISRTADLASGLYAHSCFGNC